MTLAIGAIADDLTGATDLASAIAERGLRTLIAVGEQAPPDARGFDAMVVALKSRSIPAAAAVEASLQAQKLLQAAGAKRFYFKYCSTFDSTSKGNIGPVADALLGAQEQGLILHCPSFPETGRSVLGGELFVNGVPLADSPMRHHPINPMTDSDLVRFLGLQTRAPVGLIPLQIVRKGPDAVSRLVRRLAAEGVRHAIVDAVNHDDLAVAAAAARNMSVAAGATGFGQALAALEPASAERENFQVPDGPTLILAGSCSETTLLQIAEASRHAPIYPLDTHALNLGKDGVHPASAWATDLFRSGKNAIIAASAPQSERSAQATQAGLGAKIEQALGQIAARAVDQGIRRVVVAGGETSGAVIQALGIDTLRVGPAIDPGVPVVATAGADPVALILKSGNFGRPDLLVDPFGRRLWQA
jgi:uncharacterized protein YgbK (DUF1537 family)